MSAKPALNIDQPVHLASLPARLVLRLPARAMASIERGTQAQFMRALRFSCTASIIILSAALFGSFMLALWKLGLMQSPLMLVAPSLPVLIMAPSAFQRWCMARLGLCGTMHASQDQQKEVFALAMEQDPTLLGPSRFPVYTDPWEAEILYLLLHPVGRARLSRAGLSIASPVPTHPASPPRNRF